MLQKSQPKKPALNLSDNEIRDITRHLEKGIPLPDKYRFILFGDKSQVELVWNGKTGDVTNFVLPFQVIEHVDEPRQEVPKEEQQALFGFDERGRQLQGWTNKLIWGDNRLILSSLKNGPMRKTIEEQGGIKLIYIDPPFDVGADFSMDVEVGDEAFTKKANVLEELAYRDTWGLGTDSFIAMLYERLVLMKDLLADNGSIFVHCDWRVNSFVRQVLDEVFGRNNFINEIIWKRSTSTGLAYKRCGVLHDSIYYYAKDSRYTFNMQYHAYEEKYLKRARKDENGRMYIPIPTGNPGMRPNLYYDYKGYLPHKNGYKWTRKKMEELDRQGRLIFPVNKDGRIQYKQYLDEMEGVKLQDLWVDIPAVNPVAAERVNYPTQKPEGLLERIINLASNPNDIVADFFCGSGTTSAAAEKLGRKWITADLGKFAVHTTRKRMIGVQRDLKQTGKDYRAFSILNLGKYERQHYIGVNPNLREVEKKKQLEERENAFLELILNAYNAEVLIGFRTFQAKKNNRMVAVGAVNLPVSRLFVEEVINECRQKHITKADILAFEYEMGLFPNLLEEAKSKGIDLAVKYIPRDVFDKRAVENKQVVFHDVAYIEVKPYFEGNKLAIELTDFSVSYSQDSISNVEASLKNKKSKIIVEMGQIIKVNKDKDGIVSREVLTKSWTDWIDYWAVDFDFESKKEIITVKTPDTEEFEEVWTGDYIFENEWQSFRTKKDRNLELKTAFYECPPGRKKIAIKVVDIFGNDTMKTIEVTIGGQH